MKRRTLRLLDAAGAPAQWLWHAGRAARRLGVVDLGAAWMGPLAGPPPPLRPGSPWGAALAQLAVLPTRAAPGGPAPAAAPRKVPAPQAPPLASRAPAAPRERSASRAPRVPFSPPRASPAPTAGDAPRGADPGTLARRAAEPLLRRLAGPVPPPDSRGGRSADGTASPSTRGAAGRRAWTPSSADAGRATPIPPPSGESAHEALLLFPLLPRERRAWTPSPDALPILAVRDRLRGALAGRGVGERTDGAERAWGERLAAAAGRRLPRGASAVSRAGRGKPDAPGGGDSAWRGGGAASARADDSPAPATPPSPDAVGDGPVDRAPGAPAADRAAGRLARLAAEWASPLDGPAAPAAVLARLAGRTRGAPRPRPTERPERGAGAPAGSPSPRSRSFPGTEAERAGDGAFPSLSPLLRRPRLAPSAPTADGRAGHGADASPVPFSRPPHARGGETPRPDTAEGARRDRWRGWPEVLAWPELGVRTVGSGGAPAADRAAPAAPGAAPRDAFRHTVDAADAGESARAPRPDGPTAHGPTRGAAASPSTFARAAARRPAPALGGGAVDEAPAPAGWLIDAVRALVPAPGAPAGIGGAVSPAPGAPADAAAEGGAPDEAGLPALGTGAVPLPWFLGGAGEGEGDPGGELDALAGRIRRILDDEARRHGIDV